MSQQPNSGEDIQELILRVRSVRHLPSEKSSIPVNTGMLRMLIHNARSGWHFKKSGHYFSASPHLQASIVKVSYSANKHAGQWKAHGRYLEREGAQIEGERGKGFDSKDDEVSLSQTLDRWQKEGDPYFFKIIVSPQEGERMDLEEHVRRLVGRMEEDLQTALQWAAITHHNTDQPHIHIIIRAKDENGNILSMDKQYIQQGIRHRSQEEATRKLGTPMEEDMLRRRQQAITRKHLTEIDRDILRMVDNNNRITFEGRLPRDHVQTEKRLQMIGRLQFLESMGFAQKAGVLTWEISSHMETGLKTYQLSQDILKRSHGLMGRVTEPDLPLVHTPLKEGERIAGRVIGMGLHNELEDKRFILIEGVDGKVHYTHPPKGMIRSRDSREIPNGSIIYLEVKAYSKGGQKKTYLDFQKYGDIDEILGQKEITQIDRYIAGLAAQNKTLFKDLNASTFRGKFLAMMEERLRNLQQKGIRITDKSLHI